MKIFWSIAAALLLLITGASIVEGSKIETTTVIADDASVGHIVVQSGDGWDALARRCGTTRNNLLLQNPSARLSDVLKVGQVYHCVPAPIVPPTTTTQPPVTTILPTTTTQPPVTTIPNQGTVFLEDFTGNIGLERFRTGVFHRERDAFDLPQPNWVDKTPWLADHDITQSGDCGPPSVHHEASAIDDSSSFYVCRDHMMTTMGHVSGYSVVWFSPNQVFENIERVCWDVNVSTDILGHRQWWEVAIEPAGAPEASAISWLAGTANLPSYAEIGAVVLGFGPDNPPHPKISVLGDEAIARGSVPDGYSGDVATRLHHCFIDTPEGLLYTVDAPNGGHEETFAVGRDFPSGPLQVIFKDHNYTPNKDCEQFEDGLDGPGTCRSYTWHWDNILVQ